MPTEINDSLKNFSPKPLDDKYCRFENGVARPYTGISEVLSLINIAYRHEGLTFLINDAGTVREFWFYGGILDENLVARDKALALVASTGLYEDLLDLPVIPAAQVNADWNEDTGIASILNKPTALSAFTNDPGYLSAIIAQEGLYGTANIISFGQQIGQTGNPAALTSNREIPLNGNSFQFTDTNNGSVTLFSSGNFRISTPSSSDYPCVIELNATGTASLTVADSNPDGGTPMINLSGASGYGIIMKDGQLNDRLTVTSAYTNNEGIPRSNLYMYPGSDVYGNDGAPLARVYIGGNFDPNDPLPASGQQLFKDFYQQSLVVSNSADANGGQYTTASQYQGTFAAVAPTWNTTASPTLILGNIHHYVSSGSSAKLIDLQVSGISKFAVYAGSGNTVIGNTDNGNFFQVQQPELSDNAAMSALHVTSTWNTTGHPNLIYANATNNAAGAFSNLLNLSLNGNRILQVRADAELTLYSPNYSTSYSIFPRMVVGGGQPNTNDACVTMRNDFEPSAGSGKMAEISIQSLVGHTGGTIAYIGLDIWPDISQVAGTGVIRGIYYEPFISGLTGKHIAFENTSGDVYLNSRNNEYTGRTGIHGITNPTAWVHLGPGNAAAGSAPLKFSFGTLLTTPEIGSLEFGYYGLYFTQYASRSSVPLVLFTQLASVTVANTTVETSLLNDTNALGSRTLGVAYLTTGRTIQFLIQGYRSAIGNPSVTIKVRLGSTLMLTTGTLTSSNSTNGYFEVSGTITCITWGVNATLRAQGYYAEGSGTINRYPMVNSAPVTLNTQLSQLIDITFAWGVADLANTVTITHAMIEVKN